MSRTSVAHPPGWFRLMDSHEALVMIRWLGGLYVEDLEHIPPTAWRADEIAERIGEVWEWEKRLPRAVAVKRDGAWWSGYRLASWLLIRREASREAALRAVERSRVALERRLWVPGWRIVPASTQIAEYGKRRSA